VMQPELSPETLATLNLPCFNRYPYEVVRLGPAFFHLSVLPSDWPIGKLKELTWYQAQMNDLPACLVLSRHSAFYITPEGSESHEDTPPRGGTVVEGLLRLPDVFPPTRDLREREIRLRAFVKDLKQTGYLLGDTTKGGRKPSETETRSLTGRQPNGVPLGLKRCACCREWRGECIDPNPLIGGLVVRAHCLCENRNFCARCGERLCERQVNANYYCEQDGTVWHVPGFSALKHRCVGGPKWPA
jgi:hypothetical protein